MPLPEWPIRGNTVWLLRLKIMRIWEREGYKRLNYLVTRYLSLISLLRIPPYILLCHVEGWGTHLFHPTVAPSIVLSVKLVMPVTTRSDIRMPYGTFDTTVISLPKTEAHNLNSTIASAASGDGSLSAYFPGNKAENR